MITGASLSVQIKRQQQAIMLNYYTATATLPYFGDKHSWLYVWLIQCGCTLQVLYGSYSAAARSRFCMAHTVRLHAPGSVWLIQCGCTLQVLYGSYSAAARFWFCMAHTRSWFCMAHTVQRLLQTGMCSLTMSCHTDLLVE